MPTAPVPACCCSALAAAPRRHRAMGLSPTLAATVVNQNFDDTVIQFDDGVTITHGKHVFKTGFQMWRFRLNTFYSGNSGEYGSILFGGSFSGDPASDFFTGYPEATGKGVSTGGTWHQFAWRFAGYGQDDWRITPTLTLNLGLRYEATTPWVELNNRQDNLNLVTGALEYAGVDGNSRGLYNSVYGLPAVQPRVGFAWSPEVCKARQSFAAPTPSPLTWKEPAPTCALLAIHRSPQRKFPLSTAPRPYQTQSGPGGAVPGDPFAGAIMYVWAPKVQPEMDQEWNLTVQSEASPTTTFQIGYVGDHGTHLIVPTPYSQLTLTNGVAHPWTILPGQSRFAEGHLDRIRNLQHRVSKPTTRCRLSCRSVFPMALRGRLPTPGLIA